MRQYFIAAILGICLMPAVAKAGPDFLNVDCTTEACAEQRKGYAWAKQADVGDAEACEDKEGASDAFIEGCHAYLDEKGGGEEEE